ncbi:hypothetical protein MUG78_11060 [Gordonia alkaliphila]|uniref:hypothetical protein n=1 Tax=Gordonia alkaliphila TaxID=1053547 RepID=UPI001FF49224|nr:hypothetical protein [Gordonia alkaliphila]MCK0439977.1 hypothetical protein [Gordonia alkaliphila]
MKAFFKEHWRIALAVFCTIGVFVMPFTDGNTAADRVGGTIFYFVAAVVFWFLYIRHRRRPAAPQVHPAPAFAPATGYFPPPPRMSATDGWGQCLAICYEKIRVFDEVSAATRAESVRGWLGEVSRDLHTQLTLAEDLASLGRTLEPGFTGAGSPQTQAAQESWSRLQVFRDGLDDAITSAAQIRLNASQPVTDFALIQSQLEMLKSQIPTLDVLR